jgi:hypothetical protein
MIWDMNYRHPRLPWIVAASLIAESVLFAVFAQQGWGMGNGTGWGIASFVCGAMGLGMIVMKLSHGAK